MTRAFSLHANVQASLVDDGHRTPAETTGGLVGENLGLSDCDQPVHHQNYLHDQEIDKDFMDS